MLVLIRGGGDLASGVAMRLYRAGLRVVITELDQPLAVRRLVSFAEAVFAGEVEIEGVTGRRINDPADSLRILQVLAKGHIPVLVDAEANSVKALYPTVIVDGRMLKQAPEPLKHNARLYIGLGPGFVAGENCHAVIETSRGHTLGRVIWEGAALEDTGIPDVVAGKDNSRVLRSPADGIFQASAHIGDIVAEGQKLASVEGHAVNAPFAGLLRGLISDQVRVHKDLKIGDLDPRTDPAICRLISDKALAVGGGVMEAILSRVELRKQLWS